MMIFLLCFILTQVILVQSQSCPVDIADVERRDCYPWVNGTQSLCEERGCVWCPPALDGPQCFYNDKVCPSEILEGDRVDCMPEGGGRDECLAKDCLWCETETPDIPPCFSDPSASLGGALCPLDIPEFERIDCYPDDGDLSPEVCLQRGCYWCNESVPLGTPVCFAPPQTGYRIIGEPVETPAGWRVDLQRVNTPSWFGGDILHVTLDVEFHTDSRLRLKFYDDNNARFEAPLDISFPGSKPVNPDYNVTFQNDPVFSFKVTRVSTGAVIFDSSIGGFQFADQFIQIATRLDSDNLFGFGEHEHATFNREMNWRTWPLWTRDQLVKESNGYGQHPFYVNLEQTADAHGVLFLNTNAQEVTLMPAPALTFRTIGGVLDMYIFLGPSPDQVIQQYTEAVGFPLMPPYWSLGFQLCRWGYDNITNMQAAVNRMRFYDIPHDVQYADIDYMYEMRDFTINEDNFTGLGDYVNQLKQEGTRFIIILDPALYSDALPGEYPPLDKGNELGVWVMDPTGQFPQDSQVWPGPTYYADFLKPVTEQWWTDEIVAFKERINFDGLWIDMNEPSNFINGDIDGCNDNKWNFPPYVPHIAQRALWYRTTCMDTQTELGDTYNTHSLYGWSMAKQTLPAARAASPGLRSLVFSRSTFPGAGQWGQHWLGDNWARWTNLRPSITGMLDFNLFGIPYVGADICGFSLSAEEDMCRRWQMLGAFYTYSRNHNAGGFPDQDPGIWPSVAADTRKALLIRYRLLPYLYTLFHKSHTTGSTVIRSIVFEFPADENTYYLDDQFLWGPAFMISPVLDQNVTEIDVYFSNARWYDYYTGEEMPVRGAWMYLDAPQGVINLHVRGGYVLPVQQPANSTMFSRNNPVGLLVALDDSQTASGDIFWDDGESLDTHLDGNYFEAAYNVIGGLLTGSVVYDGYPEASALVVDDLEVLGSGLVSTVTIDSVTHNDWEQDPATMTLLVRNAGIQFTSNFTVSWS